jgi:hypothetical protein
MRCTSLHADGIHTVRFNIPKCISSGLVFYLLIAAAHLSVANIEEVPAAGPGELEDNRISFLMAPIEARRVKGASLVITVETLRAHARAEE